MLDPGVGFAGWREKRERENERATKDDGDHVECWSVGAGSGER